MKISTRQVSDENLKTGLSFVGVVPDHERRHAEIFHTRKMTAEDIVHELLHVKYPHWSEDQVNLRTDKILQNVGDLSYLPQHGLQRKTLLK